MAENLTDLADVIFIDAQNAGLNPRRESSPMMRSPFTYVRCDAPDGRYILLSDAAEYGQKGVFVGRYLNEDDEGSVSRFDTIAEAVAFGKGLI